jgi:hypothetical protein
MLPFKHRRLSLHLGTRLPVESIGMLLCYNIVNLKAAPVVSSNASRSRNKGFGCQLIKSTCHNSATRGHEISAIFLALNIVVSTKDD